MRPNKLKIRGIGPYAKEVEIDFSNLNANGLFLITGATGAGKTSIFDGITYALYGKANLNDDEKLNGILSDYIDKEDYKNAFVEFSFELDGIDYKIKRTPKYPYVNRNGKESFKSETCTVEFKGKLIDSKAEVDRYIQEEVIKLSYPQFKKIMMLAQGSFNEFIKSNSDDKASILNQIFETNIYEEFVGKLKEKKDNLNRNLETERNKVKVSMKSLKIEKEEWKNILEQAYIDYKNIEIILNEEIELGKSNEFDLENKKDELNKKRDQIKKEKIEIEIINKGIDFLKEIEDNYKKILEESEEIKCLKNKEEKYQSSLKIKSSIDAYEKSFKDLSENTKKLEELNKQIISIKNENKEDIYKLSEDEMQLKELEIQFENFKKLDEQKKEHDKLINENFELQKKIEESKIFFNNSKEKKIKLEKNLEELNYEKKIIYEKVELREELDKEISELKIKIKNTESIIDVLNKRNESNKLLNKLEEEVIEEKTKSLEALEKYNTLSKLWFQNEAYKLSVELKFGEPCPVCGSEAHPNPVEKPKGIATEEEIEMTKIKYEKINTEKNKKQGSVEQLEKQIKDLGKDFFDLCSKYKIENEEKIVFELNKKLDCQLKEKGKLIKELPNKDELKFLEKEIIESETQIKKIEIKDNQLEKELILLESQKENLIREIEKIKTIFRKESLEIENFEIVKDKKNNQLEILKKDIIRIANIIKNIEDDEIRIEENSKNVEDLKKQCEEEKNRYKKNLLDNGFKSLEEYKEALNLNIIKIKQRIEEYTEEKNKNETLKDEYSKYKNKEKIENSVFEKNEKELNIQINEVEQKIKELVAKLSPLEEVKKNLHKIRKTQEKSEIEYSRIHKLYEISQGKYGNLKNNVSFQKYVLGVYFQEVLDRANIRLFSMSNKQYRMEIDKTKKGNKNSGLELNVYDTHTGKVRSIKTLSGGETFKASMALALGLSDVVQEQNGGIKLDSVFIDEGFGTLDDDSLSSAIDILTSIQNSGKTVGIISHVNELKQIIQAQILVEKDDKGSRVKVIG